MSRWYPNFEDACNNSVDILLAEGVDVDSGRWQGFPTEGQPSLVTREILNLAFDVPVNRRDKNIVDRLAEEIQPNRKWADEHFLERVGGQPLNPDPSHERWPWWYGQDEETKEGGKFTHTYSERFWPKFANGVGRDNWRPNQPKHGIRYQYGDYLDVIELLLNEPMTRQATLPIFFPEDTGAVHEGRIPCTLHYHFLRRNDQLHLWYAIRSCDALRHFRDDVYLAARLLLHALAMVQAQELDRREEQFQQWQHVNPGTLHFTAYSFHVHYGDMHHLRRRNET